MTDIRPLTPRYRDPSTGLSAVRLALAVYGLPLPKEVTELNARLEAIDAAMKPGPVVDDLVDVIFNAEDVSRAVHDALTEAARRAAVQNLRHAVDVRAQVARADLIGPALLSAMEALHEPVAKDLTTISQQSRSLPPGDEILLPDSIVRLSGATGAFGEAEPALKRILAVVTALPPASCEPHGMIRSGVTPLLYVVDPPDPGPLRFETLGRYPIDEPAERTAERDAAVEFADSAHASQHVALARAARGDFLGHAVQPVQSMQELMDRVAKHARSQSVVRAPGGGFGGVWRPSRRPATHYPEH